MKCVCIRLVLVRECAKQYRYLYMCKYTYLYIYLMKVGGSFSLCNLKTRSPKERDPGPVRGFNIISFSVSFSLLFCHLQRAWLSFPKLPHGYKMATGAHDICILGKKKKGQGGREEAKEHISAESAPFKDHSLSWH